MLLDTTASTAVDAVEESKVRPRPLLTVAILLVSDALALGVAITVGAIVAGRQNAVPLELGALHCIALLAVLLIVFGARDMYPGAGVSPVDEMRSQILTISGIASVVAIGTLIGHGPTFVYLQPVLVSWLLALMLATGARLILRELLAHRRWWGVPSVVLGAGKTAAMVIDRLRRKPVLNVKVVACLDDDPQKIGTFVGGLRVTGPIPIRAQELRAKGIDYAIVAMPGVLPDKLSRLVHKLGRTFSKVVVIPNAFGMTSIGVGTRDSGGIVGLYVRGHLSLQRNRVIKRLMDAALIVPLGLVALPLIAICALGIFVASPGNPFYTQSREGFLGRKVSVWKLRTMHRDADTILATYLQEHPEARAEWQTRFKLVDDPRILPVIGHVIRRLSLDELPQIINIFMGELSFVGPRPFPYYHLEQFDDDFRSLRSSVPPGLTGYWQVSARATADLTAQIELDTYYITNWSPWLDLYILARTPWAVLFGDGAY